MSGAALLVLLIIKLRIDLFSGGNFVTESGAEVIEQSTGSISMEAEARQQNIYTDTRYRYVSSTRYRNVNLCENSRIRNDGYCDLILVPRTGRSLFHCPSYANYPQESRAMAA